MEPIINSHADVRVTNPEDRESWKAMFDHLYSDISRLYEKERVLINTEVSEKIAEVKVALGSLVVGGSLLAAGGLSLVATSIIILDRFMPLWAAALLVTVVLLGVGLTMFKGAKEKLAIDKIKPSQSLETLGEIKSTFEESFNEFKQHH